ncbi:MAG: chromophore lyase CpcT/CpeT [Flavobacteriales bacterium]
MRALLLSLVIAVPTLLSAQWDKLTVDNLVEMMTGSFTSADQAKRDTNYANVEVETVRIWPQETKGAWLYTEEADADDKAHPYRQHLLLLKQVNDTIFQGFQYELDSMQLYMGAYKDLTRFDKRAPADAHLLKGCTMTIIWNKGTFGGSTNGEDCLNKKDGANYVVMDMTIGIDGIVSWERGFDARGNQIWGSGIGGYEFLRK